MEVLSCEDNYHIYTESFSRSPSSQLLPRSIARWEIADYSVMSACCLFSFTSHQNVNPGLQMTLIHTFVSSLANGSFSKIPRLCKIYLVCGLWMSDISLTGARFKFFQSPLVHSLYQWGFDETFSHCLSLPAPSRPSCLEPFRRILAYTIQISVLLIIPTTCEIKVQMGGRPPGYSGKEQDLWESIFSQVLLILVAVKQNRAIGTFFCVCIP